MTKWLKGKTKHKKKRMNWKLKLEQVKSTDWGRKTREVKQKSIEMNARTYVAYLRDLFNNAGEPRITQNENENEKKQEKTHIN